MGLVSLEVPRRTGESTQAPHPQNKAAASQLWPIGQVREREPHMTEPDFSRGTKNLGFFMIYQFLNMGNSFQMFFP